MTWEEQKAAITRHQNKRQTQDNYLRNKKKRLNELAKDIEAPYQRGIAEGKRQKQEEILELLTARQADYSNLGIQIGVATIADLIKLVEGSHDDL